MPVCMGMSGWASLSCLDIQSVVSTVYIIAVWVCWAGLHMSVTDSNRRSC